MFRMLRTRPFMNCKAANVSVRFDEAAWSSCTILNVKGVVVPGRMQPGPAAMHLGRTVGAVDVGPGPRRLRPGSDVAPYFVDTYETLDQGGRPPHGWWGAPRFGAEGERSVVGAKEDQVLAIVR